MQIVHEGVSILSYALAVSGVASRAQEHCRNRILSIVGKILNTHDTRSSGVLAELGRLAR